MANTARELALVKLLQRTLDSNQQHRLFVSCGKYWWLWCYRSVVRVRACLGYWVFGPGLLPATTHRHNERPAPIFQSFYKVTKNPASTTWGGFTLHLPAKIEGGGYKTNQAHERASTSTHKRLRPMHEPREEQARKKHRRLFFLSAPLRQPSQHSACGACAKLVYLGYGRERNLRRACPTHVQYSRGGDVEYHSAPLRG
jgi:hypothetical protein